LVVLSALATAQQALPKYAHKNSPKKFTQHQLFACLALKNFLRTDYRGVVAHLEDNPSLMGLLALHHVPHFTTLQKASQRLLASTNARRLLDATTQLRSSRRRRVHTAAIDSTGLECTCASAYFIKRRVRATEPWKTVVYHRYAKLGVVCDTSDHFILAYQVGRGPRPDTDEFRPLVAETLRRVRLSRVVADAGYDSEANHVFARDENRLRSMIPAKLGRPTAKPARGRYRRLMQTRFDSQLYRQRAQAETVMSMIKRRQGSYVRGRSYWSQCRDLHLLALTHNIMILLWVAVFYRAGPKQYSYGMTPSGSGELTSPADISS
jgi:Transposase DDE domain